MGVKLPEAEASVVEPVTAAAPRAVLVDGKLVMEVPLVGELGTGHAMILDLLAWDRVLTLMGDGWCLRDAGGGLYVVSYRMKARRLVGERDGSAASVVLARWLVGAGEDQVVGYRNGNPLDLRLANLAVEGRREHWDRHRHRLHGD